MTDVCWKTFQSIDWQQWMWNKFVIKQKKKGNWLATVAQTIMHYRQRFENETMIRCEYKSSQHKIHFYCGKWQVFLSCNTDKPLLSESCSLVAFVRSFVSVSKMCVVHSTELTLLNCSKFQTSCILMLCSGSHRCCHSLIWTAFIAHNTSWSWWWICIKCCTIQTNGHFLSQILLFTLSKCIVLQYIRQNISIKIWYTTISIGTCALYTTPPLVFIPFYYFRPLFTHTLNPSSNRNFYAPPTISSHNHFQSTDAYVYFR